MRCKSVERLIIAADDRALAEAERAALAEHLRGCAACRSFEADRTRIREALRESLPAAPPESLSARVLGFYAATAKAGERLAREGIAAAANGREAWRTPAGTPDRARPKTPLPVVLALVVSIVLTAALLTFALSETDVAKALTAQAWIAVVIMAQNTLTLFFAPVIFRAVQTARDESPAVPSE